MSKAKFIFRQLFEAETGTYTYLLGCGVTRKAALIDPVITTVERDAKLVKELSLDLIYGLNTHAHADHITGTCRLKKHFPAMQSIISKHAGAKADLLIKHQDVINIGNVALEARATPGHTNGCTTYVAHDYRRAFTGDALLIRGCGRTDFQGGSAHTLYNSIYEQIFSLPEDYQLFPGHDYHGRTVTSVEEEKRFNPRLTLKEADFIELMKNLNLPPPKYIDKAVPANLRCGVYETDDGAQACM
uniref:Persulfide dioxygenase ETHE1, mitochondrial n=1 Tax=Panagrellus redivivus TaxID=6233 RepID=A0A7E4WCU3_PANRE